MDGRLTTTFQTAEDQDILLWEPVRPFLENNEPLPDGVHELVVNERERCRARLQELEQEGAQARLSKLDQVLSPIRRLPCELLLVIFKIITPRREFYTGRSYPRDYPSSHPAYWIQFSLSQVCRRWRDTALGSPELWADIPVVDVLACFSASNSSGSNVPLYMKTFLSRSKSQPIHVVLKLDGLRWQYSHIEFRQLIEVLVADSHRWKTAVLTIDALDRRIFNLLPRFNLASLERLHLWVENNTHNDAAFMNMVKEIFSPTPFLRDLVVDEVDAALSIGSIFLPSIRSFTGVLRSLTDLPIHAPNLAELTLRGQFFRTFTIPSNPLVFPNLKKLKSSHSSLKLDSNRDATIYQYLRAPNVEVLEIRQRYNYVERDAIVEECVALLSSDIRRCCGGPRSELKFRRLLLHVEGMDAMTLFGLVRDSPFLEELDLRVTQTKPIDFTPVSGETDLIPNLKSLVVHDIAEIEDGFLIPGSRSLGSKNPFHVELRFSNYKDRCLGQDTLEDGWADSLQNSAEEHDMLWGWKNFLAKRFLSSIYSESACMDMRRQYALVGSPKAWRRKVHKDSCKFDVFFKHLESYSVKNPVLIESTSLRDILLSISSLPERIVPGDDDYHFRRRAQEIVEAWDDKHGDSIPIRRWNVTKDGYGLVPHEDPKY